MKKNEIKIPRVRKENFKKILRHFLSPVFLVLLLSSFLLWYTTKLGYDYTTEIPLNIRIDGQKYRITALVTGRGSMLTAQKLSLKSKINLKLEELSSRPSPDNPGSLIITPGSLQSAINAKVNDLKVLQIIEAPEFTPEPRDEKKQSAREKREQRREERDKEAGMNSGPISRTP